MNKKLPIETLTRESFSQFGWILEHADGADAAFQVVVEEPEPSGWRLAVSRVTARSVEKLARHPNTKESFTPVSGTVVFVVAAPDAPDETRAFLLDRPVCIDRNVWHASYALSDEAVVVISENLIVESEDHALSDPIG
ncbi:MAG: hypothetical protein EA426_14425 [Spirochaetaceae bacterium]|nr:MAG: hypothetical protein EA426_14425 [Spirochaetaceae bacterium]